MGERTLTGEPQKLLTSLNRMATRGVGLAALAHTFGQLRGMTNGFGIPQAVLWEGLDRSVKRHLGLVWDNNARRIVERPKGASATSERADTGLTGKLPAAVEAILHTHEPQFMKGQNNGRAAGFKRSLDALPGDNVTARLQLLLDCAIAQSAPVGVDLAHGDWQASDPREARVRRIENILWRNGLAAQPVAGCSRLTLTPHATDADLGLLCITHPLLVAQKLDTFRGELPARRHVAADACEYFALDTASLADYVGCSLADVASSNDVQGDVAEVIAMAVDQQESGILIPVGTIYEVRQRFTPRAN